MSAAEGFVVLVALGAFAGLGLRRWGHRSSSLLRWVLYQWDLLLGIIGIVVFAVAAGRSESVVAFITLALTGVLLAVGLGRDREYWQWTWPNVTMICALIAAMTALLGVWAGQDGKQEWLGADWDLAAVVWLLGGLAILTVVCLWRNNPTYIGWGFLAFAAGMAAAADKLGAATLLTALAVVVGCALSFGRIALRIVSLATLICLVVLAVRYPASAERHRLEEAAAAKDANSQAEQARSDTLIELNEQLAATAQGEERTTAVIAAADERVESAQRNQEALQPPSEAQGLNGPVRATAAWVGHYWQRLTSRPPFQSPPDLQTWQWVLLIAALLVGYRYLEVVAGRRDTGPVTVTVTGAPDPPEDDPSDGSGDPPNDARLALEDRFRLYLDETELHNSAVVPGGAETERVTKILQSEGTGNDVVDQILKFARIAFGIAIPVTGYTVSLTSQQRPLQADADTTATDGQPRPLWRVTARLSNTRTGRVLGQVTAPDCDGEDAALRTVAFWVAYTLTTHTQTLPRWARWDSPEAWQAYRQAVDTQSLDRRKTELEDALRQSPGSGLARAELANTVLNSDTTDPGDAQIEAVGRLLPVTLYYKRLTTARYRLVISLSYFASTDGWESWATYATSGSDQQQRRSVQSRIARMLYPRSNELDRRNAIGDPQLTGDAALEGQQAFIRAATREMRGLRWYTYAPIVAWWALLPSERNYWMNQLRNPRGLRHQRTAFTIAQQVLSLPAATDPTDTAERQELPSRVVRLRYKVDSISTRPHSGTHAHYNAACFYARASELTTDPEQRTTLRRIAFKYLYESIYDTEDGTWAGGWFKNDPDLESLRASEDERWRQLCRELLQEKDADDSTESAQETPTAAPESRGAHGKRRPFASKVRDFLIDAIGVGPARRWVTSTTPRRTPTSRWKTQH